MTGLGIHGMFVGRLLGECPVGLFGVGLKGNWTRTSHVFVASFLSLGGVIPFPTTF